VKTLSKSSIKMKRTIIIFLFVIVIPFTALDVYPSEVKQGDKVTIIVPGTLARLCPYPNCGSNQHITRIPEGTVLEVEGIMEVKSGILPSVKWFEVTYKGKRGWLSIFNTNKAP
jgi:hypothetical protein